MSRSAKKLNFYWNRRRHILQDINFYSFRNHFRFPFIPFFSSFSSSQFHSFTSTLFDFPHLHVCQLFLLTSFCAHFPISFFSPSSPSHTHLRLLAIIIKIIVITVAYFSSILHKFLLLFIHFSHFF